jgi:branched-chain amino acid transport system permease protein
MQQFLQQLINGLSNGAIYALIAVGYTMVYGVLRLINFAHGDVLMIGAMTGYYASTRWFHLTSPTWLGFFLVLGTSMLVCAVLGFLIELLAYRPLRDQPRILSLITAIGVSMLLEFGGQASWMFGPDPKAFPDILPGVEQYPDLLRAGQLVIGKVDALIFVVTLILMLLLRYVVFHTKMGLALRAVSFRFDTAALMGINVNRIISFTFVLGSALAAAAGILVAVSKPKVDPLMGLLPGLKAFIAAVLGGIGNITGAVVGGLLLGLIEALVVGYFPNGSVYQNGVAYVILIAILLVKPSGLLGQAVAEKV